MIDIDTHPLTQAEWQEISEVSAVREAWGLQDGEGGTFLFSHTYATKFNFVSGAPGYVGDLFISQGDALTDHPPFVLRRGKDGKLELVS